MPIFSDTVNPFSGRPDNLKTRSFFMLLMKRFFIIFSVFFLAPLAGCGDSHDGSQAGSHGEAVPAPVLTATETIHPLLHEAAGTVQAKTAGTISAKLMGTVLEVHVEEGHQVKSGDLLVSIDTRQVSARLDQARAAVSEARQAAAAAESARNAAQASADLAAATFQRYQKLLSSDSVSQQEYDEVVTRNRQAESALTQAGEMAQAARYRVKQAESGLSAATVSHGDASVRAPFDGVVVRKMVEAGDLASPGLPLLTLESTGGFEMAVDLPETLFKTVTVGKKASIRVSSLQDLDIDGTVSVVSPSADTRSRSFLVKLDLPDSAPVHAGMFARAGFSVGEEQLILIPAEAVLHQGHLTGIFLLDDENIARFRLIRTGRELDGNIEVLSGLTPGIRFVSDPPPTLVDGTPVEVRS
jgi:RND family efflux transporter MFP subunit